MFTSSIIIRRKCDLSHLDCGVVVSARFGLTVSEIADLLGFSLELLQNSAKKKKKTVSSSYVGGNVLLMWEVRGKWSELFELTGRLWYLKQPLIITVVNRKAYQKT